MGCGHWVEVMAAEILRRRMLLNLLRIQGQDGLADLDYTKTGREALGGQNYSSNL